MPNDEFERLQRSMFSPAAKEQQKQDLRRAYGREERELLRERAKCEQRLSELRGSQPTGQKEHRDWQREVAEQETELVRIDDKLRTAPERERLGRECIDSASIHQGPDGEITIYSKVGPPQPRLGYEGENRSGLESRPDQQRLHAQGAGTGYECDIGIAYGEKRVNLDYQRDGIERYIRDRYADRNPNEELWQRTVVRTDPQTKELQSIEYELESGPAHSERAQRQREFSVEISPRQGRAPRLEATVYHEPDHSQGQSSNLAETLNRKPHCSQSAALHQPQPQPTPGMAR